MAKVIGVAVALKQEAFALFGKRGWTDSAGFLTRAERAGKDLFWVVITGPGPERARLGLDRLLDCGPQVILNFGVSGSLVEDLNCGDLICPGLLRHKDQGLDIDSKLKKETDRALSCSGLNIKDGVLYTSSRVLEGPEEKRRLHERSLAHAVDMEAFFLARGCMEARVPFYCVKAISDTVTQKVPRAVTGCVTRNGGLNVPRLVVSILFDPGLLPHLLRMREGFQRAIYGLEQAKAALWAHLASKGA